jgi:hypothetical protein
MTSKVIYDLGANNDDNVSLEARNEMTPAHCVRMAQSPNKELRGMYRFDPPQGRHMESSALVRRLDSLLPAAWVLFGDGVGRCERGQLP